MNEWRTITETKSMGRTTTTIELVRDKLPEPLPTKVDGETARILYPDATADSVYTLSVFRDEGDRLGCTMFHTTGVGTKNQSRPIPIPADNENTLKQVFQIIQAVMSGEHYRIRAENRDILLKILPLDLGDDELTKLMMELKTQLAIDLL